MKKYTTPKQKLESILNHKIKKDYDVKDFTDLKREIKKVTGITIDFDLIYFIETKKFTIDLLELETYENKNTLNRLYACLKTPYK